jgi:SAM-dependent methyltransferase
MPNNNRSILRRVFPTAHQIALDRIVVPALSALEGRVLVIGAGLEPYRDRLSSATVVVVTDASGQGSAIDAIADAHALPFGNDHFDGVVAIEVFEHLKNPNCAGREMYRVLRAGGVALLSTPFMFRVHGDPYDFNRFTESGLRELLKEFRRIEVQGLGGRRHVFSDLITTLGRPWAALRIFNHLLASRMFGDSPSADCPSGFVVKAVK